MRPTLTVFRVRLARRNQRWRWRLVASNGHIVAEGGEGYANLAECQGMAERVCSGAYGDYAVDLRS